MSTNQATRKTYGRAPGRGTPKKDNVNRGPREVGGSTSLGGNRGRGGSKRPPFRGGPKKSYTPRPSPSKPAIVTEVGGVSFDVTDLKPSTTPTVRRSSPRPSTRSRAAPGKDGDTRRDDGYGFDEMVKSPPPTKRERSRSPIFVEKDEGSRRRRHGSEEREDVEVIEVSEYSSDAEALADGIDSDAYAESIAEEDERKPDGEADDLAPSSEPVKQQDPANWGASLCQQYKAGNPPTRQYFSLAPEIENELTWGEGKVFRMRFTHRDAARAAFNARKRVHSGEQKVALSEGLICLGWTLVMPRPERCYNVPIGVDNHLVFTWPGVEAPNSED